MNSNTLELKNLIEGFKLSCQTEGKSPKTVEWYISFLTRFRLFLEANKLPSDLSGINKSHIREFVCYLQTDARVPRSGKPLSGATIQGYVRTLKAFFSWATREGYVSSNEMAQVPILKAPVKIIDTFTCDQIDVLLIKIQPCRSQMDKINLLRVIGWLNTNNCPLVNGCSLEWPYVCAFGNDHYACF